MPYVSPSSSRPARTRGLKRVGVLALDLPHLVASRADAWIETYVLRSFSDSLESRPARTRGLKLEKVRAQVADEASRPARTRGLKQHPERQLHRKDSSRPARTRGLKRAGICLCVNSDKSRPARTRGLKHRGRQRAGLRRVVASRADAWIETLRSLKYDESNCRVPRGRVD